MQRLLLIFLLIIVIIGIIKGKEYISHKCCRCGKPVSDLSFGISLSDGYICRHCLETAYIGELVSNQALSSSDVIKFIDSRIKIAESFSPTRKYHNI